MSSNNSFGGINFSDPNSKNIFEDHNNKMCQKWNTINKSLEICDVVLMKNDNNVFMVNGSLNGSLNLSDIKVTSQSAIDSLQLGKYLTEYKITDKKLDSYNSSVNTNIQNILNDSDITVLQQNYKYMFWTTLAVGTVLLSMNVV